MLWCPLAAQLNRRGRPVRPRVALRRALARSRGQVTAQAQGPSSRDLFQYQEEVPPEQLQRAGFQPSAPQQAAIQPQQPPQRAPEQVQQDFIQLRQAPVQPAPEPQPPLQLPPPPPELPPLSSITFYVFTR